MFHGAGLISTQVRQPAVQLPPWTRTSVSKGRYVPWEVPGQTRRGRPIVPLSRAKAGANVPGQNPLSREVPGQNHLPRETKKQEKDVLKQEKDVLKQKIVGKISDCPVPSLSRPGF